MRNERAAGMGPQVLLLVLVTAALAGCSRSKPVAAPVPAAPPPVQVSFADATAAAGIDFVHNNGANGDKWLPETMGSGGCFIDYDGDGWQDIYLVNGRDWTDAELEQGDGERRVEPRGKTTGRLYRNQGDGTFADVTETAGLAVGMYGMGCCVGDYDNDGDDDLFVTALGRNHLFRNEDGRFSDVAAEVGLQGDGWGSSCAFLDYDGDSDLDLFVCRYVEWTPATDIWCTIDGESKSYCTPEKYTGQTSQLFRNEGTKFANVTEAAGLARTGEGQRAQGKSLGVALLDYNGDGWIDIAVANDTEPNYLFKNNGEGAFSEVGVSAGIAYSETGVARGAMGIDAGDYDRSGRPSLVVGNFANQMLALYQNQSSPEIDFFVDKAPTSELGQKSRLYLAFGCLYLDFDNDGWLDLFAANGHVEDDINRVQTDVYYAQEPLLFRNLGTRDVEGVRQVDFQYVGDRLGEPLMRRVVGRGCARADYDLDGDVDLLLTTSGGPAYLLRNDGGNRNRSLRLTLRGARQKSAIGATVRVTVGGEIQSFMVRSGSSYCSQSELPLTVGLGQAEQVDRLEIRWPDGDTETVEEVMAGQRITITQGEGITAREPFAS